MSCAWVALTARSRAWQGQVSTSDSKRRRIYAKYWYGIGLFDVEPEFSRKVKVDVQIGLGDGGGEYACKPLLNIPAVLR